MLHQTARSARCLAFALAAALLLATAPSAAAAERQNPWTTWVEDLGDREYKVEIPFLVIITIAPMIAITPIWLGQLAYDAAKGDD